jgi:serine phosphatase RsbU (regulator of sigma subunit)/anti-sigma regulatory factor (Ser/Thr protein kinase)
MLRLSTQLRLRLFVLVAVSFCLAAFTLWKGETLRARKDVETLLRINYRDVATGFTDRADFQLVSIARDIAQRFGSSGTIAPEEVAAICAEEEIAELYDINTNGVVVGGSRLVGEKVHGEQWSEFLVLLEPDGPEYMSQPDRPRTSDGKVFKYAAARYPDRSGYVEVGWSEARFLKYLRQRAYGYTRSWHIDERGYIIFVDSSGTVTSHADMSLAGKSLLEATGLDPAAVPTGTLFRAELSGMEMFCLAGPVRNYLAILADPVEDAFASRDRFMPRMCVVLLAVFAVLFLSVSRMLRKRVTDAVHLIGGALHRIAGGDLAGRADGRTSLEFAELSDNINATVDALRAAAEERVRRIGAELELAKTIQTSSLPNEPPENPVFRLSASMTPAREVGGDFYDHFRLDETRIAFLVADVSGKGITAALYMMTAKTLIKDTLLALRDPAEALTKVNTELCGNNPANMFVTAWVGVLDVETGTVAFANAGHNPPVRLVRKGKTTDPDFIASRSGPMLAFMDGIAYRQREISLVPGDTLFLYTDGVTEALDPKNELYGEDRLLVTLRAIESPEPESVCTIVRAAVTAFAAGAPQADDITVLAIKYVSRPRVFSRSFQATKEGLGLAAAFLDELLSPYSSLVDDAEKYQLLLPSLQIFLDEIGSNIVRYSGASGFVIDVELTDAPDGIRLVFFDDGTPYDPLTHVDPDTTLSADKRQIGGLGILMVKKMATSIAYARVNNRNRLTIFKEA